MEARTRIAVVPAKALTIALLVLAAFALLAGGYGIRFATASTPAAAHAPSTVSSASSSAPGVSAPCYWYNGHRGC